LSHYLAKLECATIQLYKIVAEKTFKSRSRSSTMACTVPSIIVRFDVFYYTVNVYVRVYGAGVYDIDEYHK